MIDLFFGNESFVFLLSLTGKQKVEKHKYTPLNLYHVTHTGSNRATTMTENYMNRKG